MATSTGFLFVPTYSEESRLPTARLRPAKSSSGNFELLEFQWPLEPCTYSNWTEMDCLEDTPFTDPDFFPDIGNFLVDCEVQYRQRGLHYVINNHSLSCLQIKE